MSSSSITSHMEDSASISSSISPIQVKIKSAETNEDTKEAFTIYHIHFKTNDHQWSVHERYRHLHQLYKTIQKRYPDKKYPKFPSKKWFGSTSTEVVMSRIRQLEDYLVAILSDEQVLQMEEVCAMFQLKEHYWTIVSHVLTIESFSFRCDVELIPSKLVHLANFIIGNGLDCEYLFFKIPSKIQMDQWKEKLNIESEEQIQSQMEELDPHVAAMIMKDIIVEQHCPLLEPYDHFLLIADFPSVDEKKEKLVEYLHDLPKEKLHFCWFLVEFLQIIVKHSEQNKMDLRKMSSIWGNIFLRPPLDGTTSGTDKQKVENITKFILEHESCFLSAKERQPQKLWKDVVF